ncbi:MAG: hypothetical protein CBE24_01905 [bacterium TMED264]|nr:MAG: hypothetical protein CBE24_01905 [bacterium TMED264]
MILILPVTFLLIFLHFYKKNNKRLAFINSYLILSFQIFFVTELLTFFQYLNSITVFFSHLLFAISYYFYFSPKITYQKIKVKPLDFLDKTMLGLIIFISAITLIIAIISPPNNWDSMSYHLSRIQHWIQNNGVHFFGTNNFRQNLFSPFSEFIILHTQILSNSDVFANSVQWFNLIICMSTISLICKEFGLSRRLQLFSAFFICSMPIVILESSSTQNDIILSTFILLFYYYQLCSIKNPSRSNLYFSGLSLGLGVLTKGTSYVFLFSIGVTYFLYSFIYNNSISRKTVLHRTIGIIFIGLSINIPHYTRSFIKYGDFLGLNSNQIHANEIFSLLTIFSNFIRHLAFQLGSNIELLNWYLYRIVQIFLGDKISDPKTSFLDRDFRPPFFSLHEDSAGNFIHTVLISIVFILSFFLFRKIRKIQMTSFLISLVSILLYCLLFKWQPWTGKILSLLIVVTPFTLVVVSYAFKDRMLKIIISFVLFILLIGTLPYLFLNKSRPLLPLNNKSIIYQDRLMGYFNNRPELFKQYQSLVKNIIINDVEFSNDYIAYHLGGDTWEYPFWVMLKEKFSKKIPFIFNLRKDDLHNLIQSNSLPIYIILENRLFINLEKIEKCYDIISTEQNFSLLKKSRSINEK